MGERRSLPASCATGPTKRTASWPAFKAARRLQLRPAGWRESRQYARVQVTMRGAGVGRRQVTFDFLPTVFFALRKSPAEFAAELRLAAAIHDGAGAESIWEMSGELVRGQQCKDPAPKCRDCGFRNRATVPVLPSAYQK